GEDVCKCAPGLVLSEGVCSVPLAETCEAAGAPCEQGGSCETTESGQSICCSEGCSEGLLCHSTKLTCVECETEAPLTCVDGDYLSRCRNNSVDTVACPNGCIDGASSCLQRNGTVCGDDAQCASSNCSADSDQIQRCCSAECTDGCNAQGNCEPCEGTGSSCA